jgi:hypothetical protein
MDMGKQAKKLVLSKETLRHLDDQDLSAVVGGTVGPLQTVLCNGTGGLTGLGGLLGNTTVCVELGQTLVCVQ